MTLGVRVAPKRFYKITMRVARCLPVFQPSGGCQRLVIFLILLQLCTQFNGKRHYKVVYTTTGFPKRESHPNCDNLSLYIGIASLYASSVMNP